MPEFVPWNWEMEPSDEAEVPDPDEMGEVSLSSLLVSSLFELPLLLPLEEGV